MTMGRTIISRSLETSLNPQELSLPKGALFLAAQLHVTHNTILMLWFEVDIHRERERRGFRLLETGVEIPPSCKIYLSTFQHGLKTLHLYEEDKDEAAAVINSRLDFENVTYLPTGTA
jgi:hypothetical protein